MKKTELVGKIETFLRLNYASARHTEKAEEIIRIIERAGMLPPLRREAGPFFKKAVDNMKADGMFGWESEYEKIDDAGWTPRKW
jgi:hypothetical protein